MGTKMLCNARNMSRHTKTLRLFPTPTTARFVVSLRRSIGVFLRTCKTISVDFTQKMGYLLKAKALAPINVRRVLESG